jgi:tRNA dimethylallyltransferase
VVKSVKTIHIIAGPTASGKSALALERAMQNNGVIINVDSRQIYKDLPILTAHPAPEEMQSAPHRLYGVLDANTHTSAGNWREMAVPVIEETLAAGKTPIVTGGSGMYLKTLMEGISPIPDVPDEIRTAAVAKQKELGNPQFYEELKKRDPETAALYHPMHTARLVHAWEILEATGKPLAYWQSLPKEKPPEDWHFDVTLVMPEREELYKRCDARFLKMLEAGAAEELEEFDARVERGEIRPDSILIRTLGAEPLRQWRKGMLSKEEAIVRAQTETRQYAKRQVTWFKHQIKTSDHPINY